MPRRLRSRRMKGLCLAVVALLAAAALARQARVDTRKLPMTDGTLLGTDVHLPQGPGPFPVIVMRTPYSKDASAGAGKAAAARGYAVVIQDTRGRFGSQGANLPFEADGWWEGRMDGADTLAWVAKQPWCNGKIGTMGGSAVGITQLLAAGTGSPHITSQYIQVATPRIFNDAVFPGGILRKNLVEGWLTSALFSPESHVLWKGHPTYSDFWQKRDLTLRFGKTRAPAVHMGGWYDIFCQGTIDAFTGMQTRGGVGARGTQKLVMGPWTHGILQNKAGELGYRNGNTPPNRAGDPFAWFDATLKGQRTAMTAAPAVTYYTMGDAFDASAPGNVWRTASTWPRAGVRVRNWYLTQGKGLTPQRPAAGSLSYAYDPRNPAPTVGGPQLLIPAGPMEQSRVEGRPDVLVFTSEPLAAPLEVTGRVRAYLTASSDCPDTDFVVRLCDVYPDGRSYNVCEGGLRARYRKSLSRETLLTPGKAERFGIDLWSTSIVFNRGHRIRLQVSSSSDPGLDPNPNTGEPFRSSTRTRVARNSLLLGGVRASYLALPEMGAAGR